MNIDERHPLSHTWGHACHRSLAYWWVCYRVFWTCNCLDCCWIWSTLIQFTLVDFVHRVWHTHPWDKLHSYSNMWTCWMRNEPNPRPLWRRTYTVIGKLDKWQIGGNWAESNESEVHHHREWMRSYHLKAWVRYDRRDYHEFLVSGWYQSEYRGEESGETILHQICHSRHVQTHHLRFLLQCVQEHIR